MLPAAPPPVASVAAARLPALHRAGPVVAAGTDDDDEGPPGDADVVDGLEELVAGCVVVWPCGWEGPHPVSISAAAATAVVITNPCEIR
jgi:hypothetical protein